jgi:hypothetical protein
MLTAVGLIDASACLSLYANARLCVCASTPPSLPPPSLFPPPFAADGDDGAESLSVSGRSVSVGGGGGAARVFDADVAYGAHVPTTQLYNEQVDPLISKVLAGYNACVLAYGALRSGKAHTVFGGGGGGNNASGAGGDDDGFINLAADSLFAKLHAQSHSCKALVSLSAFDVYSSQILDLLNPQTKTGLNLAEHRASGTFVEGLAELVVTSAQEVRSLLKQALAVHDALEARITNQLGKAHSFVDLRVEVIDNDNPSTIRYATLRFVSTAGAGAVALKFNQGLQALNKVVDVLAEGKAEPWNVPFGASRLTKLLEGGCGAFSPNAITLWITTLDPSTRGAADSIHCLEVAAKVMRIRGGAGPASSSSSSSMSSSSLRVNKNTLASSIRELREEIARVRGKLQLTQPGLYSHDIDPQNLKILKGLLAELERVKANGWDKRQARSVGFHEARRANLEQEGLLYTLQADLKDVEVPPALTSQARTLLSSIVSSRANLDDEETSLAEKRNLFKLRLDTVQRKAGATATSVAELVKSDEKLGKLERTIGELDDKLRLARSELQGLEDEYRKVLAKMAAIESKQRKVYLLGKDAAGLDRLNKANEWATMRKEAESDANLSQALAQLAQQAEQQKQALAASNDAQALKDAALQAVDQMREAQENVRGHAHACTDAHPPLSATTTASEGCRMVFSL